MLYFGESLLTQLKLVGLDDRDLPDLDALLRRVGNGCQLRLGNGFEGHRVTVLNEESEIEVSEGKSEAGVPECPS